MRTAFALVVLLVVSSFADAACGKRRSANSVTRISSARVTTTSARVVTAPVRIAAPLLRGGCANGNCSIRR